MLKFPQFIIILATILLILALGVTSFSEQANERYSPANHLNSNDISITKDAVTLAISNPQWTQLTNTNSMDPLLDEDTQVIQIAPKNEEHINVGDIISYKREEKIILHRVIAIKEDAQGIYYVLKGDNNTKKDKEKVRFEQVTGIVVAIIY